MKKSEVEVKVCYREISKRILVDFEIDNKNLYNSIGFEIMTFERPLMLYDRIGEFSEGELFNSSDYGMQNYDKAVFMFMDTNHVMLFINSRNVPEKTFSYHK